MLRVEDGRSRPALLSKPAIERTGPDIRFDIAPSVPLIARDSFVTETANKIEQLQATMRLMVRDLGDVAGKVADLQTFAEQERRLQTFQKGDKRFKEARLEELVRGCRDLKARLDRIEARTGGDFHAYNNFEAVSRKLADFESLREDAKSMRRTLTLKAWLLSAAVGASALVIVIANALAS